MSDSDKAEELGRKIGHAIGFGLVMLGVWFLLGLLLRLVPNGWVTVMAVGRWPVSFSVRPSLMLLLIYFLFRRERK